MMDVDYTNEQGRKIHQVVTLQSPHQMDEVRVSVKSDNTICN
jgi:hypothetical protein